MTIKESIPEAIGVLKSQFMQGYRERRGLLSELLPVSYSRCLPIENNLLDLLHKFALANSIYTSSHYATISGIPCRIYEGDINNYWLSSKKHDTSYQPFYPTWMLSALALALEAQHQGFDQLVDIGSGDGRIAYCASLVGLDSYGIEIDYDLVELQNAILSGTGVTYHVIRGDATQFDYNSLDLSKPIFFISGLPEMGEMLANSVIQKVLSVKKMKGNPGFNFMGSHVMKPLARDRTSWGWGNIIVRFDLEVLRTVSLPTLWTSDQILDTAYVYTRVR
jgi:hypothetical protein